MRILHVCDSIIGGTGSYLAELLTLQAQQLGPGRVMLLIPREHRDHIEPRLANSGVEFSYFTRPGRLTGILLLAWAYLTVRRSFRPTIVHGHTFGAGLVTRLLRWRKRPRLVFCPHGWAFNIELPAPARRMLILVEQLLALRSDRIILISEHEQRRARAIGIADHRLSLVPNGISTITPDVAAVPWEDDRLKLLFVGRFDRQKGLDILVDAVRPLRDKVTLRIVGAPAVGHGYHPPALDFIDVRGWRDRDGVVAEMKACDVLVVPSRWEGFGLVAVEAMRLGKPVVAAAAGGLRDTLEDGRYGVVVPRDDPAALRAALLALTPTQLAHFAALGPIRFNERYTARRMADDIDTMYRELEAE